jgi:hypothetical protein
MSRKRRNQARGYNQIDDYGSYLPTPEEIRKKTLQIQCTWTPRIREVRAVVPELIRYEVPELTPIYDNKNPPN